MGSLTDRVLYKCSFSKHLGDNRELFPLFYLNGHESGLHFCEPCSALYCVGEDGKLKYFDMDLLDELPDQYYVDKKGSKHFISPIDFVED